MVTCHICHIYGIWRSRGGGYFEVIIWGEGGGGGQYKPQEGSAVLMRKEGWGSHYM